MTQSCHIETEHDYSIFNKARQFQGILFHATPTQSRTEGKQSGTHISYSLMRSFANPY